MDVPLPPLEGLQAGIQEPRLTSSEWVCCCLSNSDATPITIVRAWIALRGRAGPLPVIDELQRDVEVLAAEQRLDLLEFILLLGGDAQLVALD
jgi:hypothetical protein